MLKKRVSILLALVFCLSLAYIPAASAAVGVVLTEDFERTSGYSVTRSGNGGTSGLNGNYTDGVGVDGSRGLQLLTSNDSGARSHTINLAARSEGTEIMVEFDWQVGTPSSNANAGGLFFQNSAGQKILGIIIQNSSTATNRIRYYAGHYTDTTGTGAGSQGTALTELTTLNAWYAVKVVFKFDKRTVDLTMTRRGTENTQTVTDIPFDMHSVNPPTDYVADINSLFAQAFRSSGANHTWSTTFDNFVFTVLKDKADTIEVESVALSGREKVEVGGKIIAYADVRPTTAEDRTLTWTSSNPEVATVDAKGYVTGVSEGTTVITAEAVNGVKGTMTITVGPLGLPAYQLEKLDRGVVAVPARAEDGGGTFISWRIMGDDPAGIAFNIYRDGEKINPAPIAGKSNYVDNGGSNGSLYQISTIIDGREATLSEEAKVWANGYLSIPLSRPPGGVSQSNGGTEGGYSPTYTYTAHDSSAADLDGDGEYEIIIKWQPSNAQDNSFGNGHTGPVIIEAVKMDGTSMWRIHMGVNIRAGEHYVQLMVYDLDGDGKAEVVLKTADGTTDGLGNVIGDPEADYRNNGGHIAGGTEYLTVFSGETGENLYTTLYSPQRGSMLDWGDATNTPYNRSDRFLAGIAYLDGKTPSVVMCRGYYQRSYLAAWTWDGEKLTNTWNFDSDIWGAQYMGQGNHQLAVADVDGDGCDEIVYGSMTIDHDGTPLYSTGLTHGDTMQVGDFDPSRPGLEVYAGHESPMPYTSSLRDAQTGEVLLGHLGAGDNERAMAAHIDSRFYGYQLWASRAPGVYNVDGTQVASNQPSSNNHVIWWEGGLTRDLLNGSTISKWVPPATVGDTGSTSTVLTMSGTGTNGKSVPCLTADIFGDWREDIVIRNSGNTELRIYVTNIPTEYGFYTLMHDRQYRLAIAWQNVAYNQSPNPSFYIGTGMEDPPVPNAYYIGNYVEPAFPGSESAFDISYTGFTNLVIGCAANIPAVVEADNPDGLDVYVGLFVDGDLIASAPVVNGKALIKSPAINGTNACLAAWFEGGEPEMTTAKNIPLRNLPSNIWKAEVIVPGPDGRTAVLFGDNISLIAGATVKIDGTPVSNFSADGPILYIEAETTEGQTIEMKGVKYPELFPSYSFTFTVTR